MSNAYSPVLSHSGAAIAGIGAYSAHSEEGMVLLTFVVSIRAYSAQNLFRQNTLHLIDTRSSHTFYNLNRWASIRTDTVGTVFSAVLVVYLVYGTGAVQKPGSAANAGFSFNMTVGFGTMILWWVRCLNKFEVSGNRYDLLALCVVR